MKFWKSLPENGFTLIEVLITLAISGVIMTGVYTAFKSQQDSYLAQEQVAEVQQNIRAGLDMMVRDIRMAGFTGNENSQADFIDAEVDALAFSADFNEDGAVDDSGENIAFDLYGTTLGRLANNNANIILTEITPGHYEASGLSSGGATVSHQPLAENIENLEFFYTLEDGTQTTAPADPSNIRSVEISILARARRPDLNYTNNQFYCPASHPSLNTTTSMCEDPDGNTLTPWWGNDNFRRRFQITTVNLRNMGL